MNEIDATPNDSLFEVTNWIVDAFTKAGMPPVWINRHSSYGSKVNTLLFGGLDVIAIEAHGGVKHWTRRGRPNLPFRDVGKWCVSVEAEADELVSKLVPLIEYRRD